MDSKRNIISRGVHILRDDVARKIVAGEVIDRPFSIIRELMDNSLDAEGDDISVFIENGGISRIRVVDNGCGMNRDDLSLCFHSHATSKIHNAEDIYSISTLGFRGEALAAISTCSHMEIISAREGESHGHQLLVHGGKLLSLDEHKSRKGTIVDVSSLFYNMPGRRKFLKSPSGETSMCKATFIDKALPFPGVSFKFSVNGKMKLLFPATTLLDRVRAVLGDTIPPGALEYMEEMGEDFSVKIIAARPEIHRKDKKYIRIFVNRRRVYDYACIQAVEYGYSGCMPGKDHPVACVLIEVNPSLVDFNIHPAKKECKIQILPRIHKCIVSLIQSFVQQFSISVEKSPITIPQPEDNTLFEGFHPKGRVVCEQSHSYTSFSSHKDHGQIRFKENKSIQPGDREPDQYKDHPGEKETGQFKNHHGVDAGAGTPQVLGQIFGLFLVVQYRDKLYIIDQHAAHERLLYEELQKKKPVKQDLLFPVAFDVSRDEEEHIKRQLPSLREKGIVLEKAGEGCYEITALPDHFHTVDSKEIVDFLKNLEGMGKDLEHQLNSLAACRNAIKDGDVIDELTAQTLVRGVFTLENARCPHGRPVWYVITREELFKLLGRK